MLSLCAHGVTIGQGSHRSTSHDTRFFFETYTLRPKVSLLLKRHQKMDDRSPGPVPSASRSLWRQGHIRVLLTVYLIILQCYQTNCLLKSSGRSKPPGCLSSALHVDAIEPSVPRFLSDPVARAFESDKAGASAPARCIESVE